MNIALDLDGVLFDFNTHFVEFARKHYPQLSCPNVSNQWPRAWDYLDEYLGRPEVSKLWRKVLKSPSFWRDCPSYWWSPDLLEATYERGDHIYFITSRQGHHPQRQTWMALLDVTQDVSHSGAVIPVMKPEDKIPLLNALRIDYFVDDKKETVAHALAECPNTQVACWDQPWNRDVKFPVRLTSVEDFKLWLQ